MKIRKAEMKDVNKLNSLLTLLIRDEKQYDDTIDENFTVTNMYENYIYDLNRLILVAEENNNIIGYIYGYITNDEVSNRTAVLDALYIEKEYRNKGTADKLINYFKKWVSDNNIDIIDVNVCSDNIKAKNLYKKHNFNTIKETMRLDITK